MSSIYHQQCPKCADYVHPDDLCGECCRCPNCCECMEEETEDAFEWCPRWVSTDEYCNCYFEGLKDNFSDVAESEESDGKPK